MGYGGGWPPIAHSRLFFCGDGRLSPLVVCFVARRGQGLLAMFAPVCLTFGSGFSGVVGVVGPVEVLLVVGPGCLYPPL